MIQNEAKEKSKLRFFNNAQKKNYINQLGYHETKIILKLKLNMIELKCNYKSKDNTNMKCNLCKIENDTTEHLFTCNIIKEKIKAIPTIDTLTKNDSESCTQLVEFIKKALNLKGIDITKSVKDNLGNTKV